MSAQRLSAARAGARLPYDRSAVTPGIVHLGIGAFHRAHMAVYIDDILSTDPSWGIVGASLRRPDTRNALAPQDFLYTVAIRSGAGTSTRVIGSLLDILDATAGPGSILAAMTDPRIRIVSLTVTEKGYCHDPTTGTLDTRHPDIQHDLAHPDAPLSAPGLLVRAIELRQAAGSPPFTVLSCDNLPMNGETTARIVTGLAAMRSADLARFISETIAFPSTMVDRIVPAVTEEDREFVRETIGLDDAWPVVTEPFSQWVIEDRFAAARPPLDTVGVQFTADVKPFEHMKLRMLNGSHSTIAYLGYLTGYQFVSDAVADPDYRALIHGLMTQEVMHTLPKSLGDLPAYRDALLDRFANPALKHRTWQIAMDGSQKLPQRLLGTIRDRLKENLSSPRAMLGVAAWMRYVMGRDDQGQPIEVKDPMAARLATVGAAGGSAEALVDGFLSVREIFGTDLRGNPDFSQPVAAHLAALLNDGARATVHRLAAL